tara:strand:- start:1845 stop:2018 length:174 start_codon:yes stop_codon:yes gene_type:complete
MKKNDLPDDINELKDIILYQREVLVGLNKQIDELKVEIDLSRSDNFIVSKNIWENKN